METELTGFKEYFEYLKQAKFKECVSEEDYELWGKLLLKDGNISVLEDLLDFELRKFSRLKKLNDEGKLDFGDYAKPKELSGLLLEVKKDVDKFLGVSDVKPPRISSKYGAGAAAAYQPLTRRITVQRMKRASIIPAIGHEYAHHIQNEIASKCLINTSEIFSEGHACGVSRHLAELFNKREDNLAFLHDCSWANSVHIKNTYFWMCLIVGVGLNQRLCEKADSIVGTNSLYIDLLSTNFHSYSLGTALFSIYEQKHGKGIYKDVVHGNFEFH